MKAGRGGAYMVERLWQVRESAADAVVGSSLWMMARHVPWDEAWGQVAGAVRVRVSDPLHEQVWHYPYRPVRTPGSPVRAGRHVGRIALVNGPRQDAWRAVTGGAGMRNTPSLGAVFDQIWIFVDARSEGVSITLHQAVLWEVRR